MDGSFENLGSVALVTLYLIAHAVNSDAVPSLHPIRQIYPTASFPCRKLFHQYILSKTYTALGNLQAIRSSLTSNSSTSCSRTWFVLFLPGEFSDEVSFPAVSLLLAILFLLFDGRCPDLGPLFAVIVD